MTVNDEARELRMCWTFMETLGRNNCNRVFEEIAQFYCDTHYVVVVVHAWLTSQFNLHLIDHVT